jgi:hypothetical protein
MHRKLRATGKGSRPLGKFMKRGQLIGTSIRILVQFTQYINNCNALTWTLTSHDQEGNREPGEGRIHGMAHNFFPNFPEFQKAKMLRI